MKMFQYRIVSFFRRFVFFWGLSILRSLLLPYLNDHRAQARVIRVIRVISLIIGTLRDTIV